MSSARTSVKEKTDYSSLKRNGLIKKDTRCGRRAKHNVVVIIYNGLDILGVSVSGAQFFLLHSLFSPRSPFGDRFAGPIFINFINYLNRVTQNREYYRFCARCASETRKVHATKWKPRVSL